MATARLLHLLKDAPVVAPPDADTLITAQTTPTAGLLTTRLLDPSLPALAATQVLAEVKAGSQAQTLPHRLVHGRWVTRPLPAQTIGAGDWYLHTAIRHVTATSAYADPTIGACLAQWRPSTGAVVARLFDRVLWAQTAFTLTMNGGPTGGTMAITEEGVTASTIQWNSTAAQLVTQVTAASGSIVTGSGGPWPGTPIVVTYIVPGPRIIWSTQSNALTGGASPAVAYSETTSLPTGTYGARIPRLVSSTQDSVSHSRLTGGAVTIADGDCLVLELWTLTNLTTTSALDFAALLGGLGQYVAGLYTYQSLTDTDAYLLSPSAITYS